MLVVAVHYLLQLELWPFCQRNRASDGAVRCRQMWMAAPYRALSRILKVGNVPRPNPAAVAASMRLRCMPNQASGPCPNGSLRLIAQQLCQPGFFRRGQVHRFWRKRVSPPAANNNEQGNSKQHGCGRRSP